MSTNSIVYLVDDDPRVLRALARLLRVEGIETQSFSSPQAFLEGHDPARPGCAVVDMAMPDLDGLKLQRALAVAEIPLPIIFLSGRSDVPTSVKAMKAGAVDFLTKPVKADDLIAAVRRAVDIDLQARRQQTELNEVLQRLGALTPREREVLQHVVAGRLNKQIAAALGTVEKTIKVHRARVMEKMHTRSIVELVRMTQRAGIGSHQNPPSGTA